MQISLLRPTQLRNRTELSCLFEQGPSGPTRAFSITVQEELRLFVHRLRAEVGVASKIRTWPYRYAGKMHWAFDVDGSEGQASLTFVESGKTYLPHDAVCDGTGQVADSVDAYYLLEMLRAAVLSQTSLDPE